jgi:hypothetical protein
MNITGISLKKDWQNYCPRKEVISIPSSFSSKDLEINIGNREYHIKLSDEFVARLEEMIKLYKETNA